MQRQTINDAYFSTLTWTDHHLIDLANSATLFLPDGQIKKLENYYLPFSFDSALSSSDGVYSVLYNRLGTKGLIMKNKKILREINRSYYHAGVYEYPIAFAKLKDGRDIRIHCPNEYNRLEFEEVETGLLLTDHADRNPSHFFHSRLEVSPDNKTFLSKGWAWHPYDFVEIFDIEECLESPKALDKSKLIPDVSAEICTASFITNELVLIGSPNETEPFDDEPSNLLENGEIGIWNVTTNEISDIIKPNCKVGGNLIAIDDTFAWELFRHPKIINFRTGEIVEEIKEIYSGKQISSIIHSTSDLPLITFNRKTKQIAIAKDTTIEILTK